MAEALRQIIQTLGPRLEPTGRGAVPGPPGTLKDFVTDQVLLALTQDVFSPDVETDLLALRQLFADYDGPLPSPERARRLAQARAILARLRRCAEPEGPAGGMERTDRPRERPDRALSEIPVRFAKGVGPKRAALMERLGIVTVEDALWYVPRRYEDRSTVTPIARVRPGSRATICGVVVAAEVRRTQRRGITILEATVEDSTGRLPCLFYNQPYLERSLGAGTTLMASGPVSAGRRGWKDLRMDAPQFEVLGEDAEATLHVGRIVPVYPETKGLTSRHLRTIVRGILDEHLSHLEEIVPEAVLGRQGLPGLRQSIAEVHFPSPGGRLSDLDRGVTLWHQRMAFEELFVLEVALALRQRAVKEEVKGIGFDVNAPLLARLRTRLPFELTAAQARVWQEIARDMGASRPMNRLLQGDVGCGKTIIALHALVVACGSGYQAALMAPTEILAEQHFLTLRELLESVGVRAVLLKSGGTPTLRARTLDAIRSGEAGVVMGTHSLIQKDVAYSKLGLVVIDEQHKFGVLQRKTLLEKGYRPDVLVLTATPIPRTLAMTLYGDLDLSVIDALPPGRRPVRTLLFHESRRRKAYDLIRDELRAGRQAYVVYPLVEESEKVDLQAALQAASRLQTEEFRGYSVGVLHGRLKTEEKARTMRAFKAGEVHVLVATTVVEVGVDVPNATVMLIEHAERFGLAQLHQLRGRVGRGAAQSYCLLLTSARITAGAGDEGDRPQTGRASPRGAAGDLIGPLKGPIARGPEASGRPASAARQRLEALVRSSDGFVIAEEDLKIRGPGEFFGTRQWGAPEFRVANLLRDGALLERARQEAFGLLAEDPGLRAPAHLGLRRAMLRRWQAKLDLGDVG